MQTKLKERQQWYLERDTGGLLKKQPRPAPQGSAEDAVHPQRLRTPSSKGLLHPSLRVGQMPNRGSRTDSQWLISADQGSWNSAALPCVMAVGVHMHVIDTWASIPNPIPSPGHHIHFMCRKSENRTCTSTGRPAVEGGDSTVFFEAASSTLGEEVLDSWSVTGCSQLCSILLTRELLERPMNGIKWDPFSMLPFG